eukprot:CAMPEP_0119357766 /NCGR_PEP_ID=MMETSP1334-20130426/6097_1 /TAXON_ID=127549 /ORGANISM="Calcidiscus leptoporus, Strain RCC1130" /LENGTH=146 /DNA_ID=CAMNT_0007372087 /DNA_START=181 /DNA_END=623 /DNA_ORIENTATION=+
MAQQVQHVTRVPMAEEEEGTTESSLSGSHTQPSARRAVASHFPKVGELGSTASPGECTSEAQSEKVESAPTLRSLEVEVECLGGESFPASIINVSSSRDAATFADKLNSAHHHAWRERERGEVDVDRGAMQTHIARFDGWACDDRM